MKKRNHLVKLNAIIKKEKICKVINLQQAIIDQIIFNKFKIDEYKSSNK